MSGGWHAAPRPKADDLHSLLREKLNPSQAYSPMTHVTAGGIAGAVAAAVTTPLDVCKTLLQTRGSSDDAAIRKARGMSDAARIIWERQGAAGFARGMTPRILTNMPSNALCCESEPSSAESSSFRDPGFFTISELWRACGRR